MGEGRGKENSSSSPSSGLLSFLTWPTDQEKLSHAQMARRRRRENRFNSQRSPSFCCPSCHREEIGVVAKIPKGWIEAYVLFANGERESFTSDKKGKSKKENALGEKREIKNGGDAKRNFPSLLLCRLYGRKISRLCRQRIQKISLLSVILKVRLSCILL